MKMSDLQQQHALKKQGGFTLVELAIVMIIIGLLIGGILKGQELISNAQVTATIAQIKGIDAAVATFRDKYSTLPGDMATPNTRLRDCTAAPCSRAGNANGRIDVPALGTAPTAAQEGLVAFTHLAASDLISGVDINGTANFGSALPEAKMGGGFWIGFTANGVATGVPAADAMRAGHYLVFNALVANAGGTAGMTASQAARVDRKIDDGDPQGGAARGHGTGCVTGGNYNEAIENSNCSMYLRIQG